jgi:hypothetical protein
MVLHQNNLKYNFNIQDSFQSMFHLNATKQAFLSEASNLPHPVHKLRQSHIGFHHLIVVCCSQEAKI